MKALYFSGKAGGGKTATALGVGLKLKEAGYRVSYFKPVGFTRTPSKKIDDDVALMRKALDLPFPSEKIAPLVANAHYLSTAFMTERSDLYPRIEAAFAACSKDCDVILIDGGFEPTAGFSRNLDDFYLAEKLGASVLVVIKAENDLHFDQNLYHLSNWADGPVNLVGCLFNNVTQAQLNKCKTVYRPLLEERNIPVLGIMPRRLEISSPTVAGFQEVLQGELLAAEDHLDRVVEDVVIGTMTIESALSYLRRAPNKALITGGDRSDMALTALETSTAVIIFTGGLYPDVRVLARAEEMGVPVILVHTDTYSTVESLHGVYRSIDPHNAEAIKIVRENTEKYLDWEKIESYLDNKKAL